MEFGRKLGKKIEDGSIRLVEYRNKTVLGELFYFTAELADERILILGYQVTNMAGAYQITSLNEKDTMDELTLEKENEISHKIKRKIHEITRLRKLFQ